MLDSERESLFRHWLAEHSPAILKVARSYAQTPDDGQDLSQEILLQLWRSLPHFNAQASALTWCYRVALNTALTWRRNEGRRRARQPLIELNELPASGPDSAEQTAHRETVERLYAAIRQLSTTDAALVLLYLDDLSYRQIAEVLGISENHVGVKLNRAKQALARLLREESHEP